MIKKIYILLFVLCASAGAQNSFMYRQYVLNQLGINPGYTGSREVFVLGAQYRESMRGFEGHPRSYTISADSPLKNNKMALGFYGVHDQIGNTSNFSFETDFAYRLQLGERGTKLSMGLKGVVNYFTEVPLLDLDEQDDEILMNPDNGYLLPNFGFGMYLYDYNKYFVGLSIPTLMYYQGGGRGGYNLDTDFGHVVSNYHYMASAGVLMFRENENFKWRLSGVGEFNIRTMFDFDINTMFIIKDLIWVGGSYYTGGIAAFMAQWQINPQLRVGYSYDLGLGEVKHLSEGHEIMIRYELSYLIKAVSPIF